MNTDVANYRNIFVGRQPILGPNLKTIGYEVLFRNCDSDSANIQDEELATLSVLEALYGSSMEKMVGTLPLPDDIREALILEKGPMGAALSSVKAYEKGEWLQLKKLQLSPGTIREFYLEAIDWANHFSPMIAEPA